jgi:hypothetical protein
MIAAFCLYGNFAGEMTAIRGNMERMNIDWEGLKNFLCIGSFILRLLREFVRRMSGIDKEFKEFLEEKKERRLSERHSK